MSSRSVNRRHFLMGTAGLAVGSLIRPTYAQNGAGKRLNIAQIGAMGKGESDMRNVAKEHNIVALVDVDSGRLDAAAKSLAKGYEQAGRTDTKAPALYADFRKMFDEMSKDIDAVIISTPDHTHYVAAMWAVKNKKHICVQKPLCNTIMEVRQLHKAAKDAGVVTQMGNQGRTMEGQRLAKEWVEQGAIGKLQEIHLWTNRPIWPQGPLTKQIATCPPNLNWDLWLSSEVEEPYFEFGVPGGDKKASVHPFNWRGWWQYGSGALGDMGCHVMDATFNILGQRVPPRVKVDSGPVSELNAPVWTNLNFYFPANERYPAIKVTWHDGSRDGKPNKPERDPRVPEDVFNKASSGMMLVGSEGVIFEGEAYCEKPVIYPEARFADVKKQMENGQLKKTEARSPRPGNPQAEWAHCIVNGGTPSSNFDYSAPLAEFVLLGNVAVRDGGEIEWDQKTASIANIASARRYLSRPAYRKGWM